MRNEGDLRGDERRRLEAALRECEARYRAMVENAQEAIVVFELDRGRFVDANDNAVRMFGLSRKELLETGPVEMSPPVQPDGRPSAKAALAYLERAVAGRVPPFEWMHRDASGREFPCEVRLVKLPSSTGRLVRGSVTDISERKRAEQALRESEARLRQAQKMEAVGQLASGIAHDFNNLLTAIHGHVDLALQQLDPSHPAWEDLQKVAEAATQAEGVTRALLAISRRSPAVRRPVRLADVVDHSIGLLEHTLPASIDLRLDRAAPDAWVDGDADQLGQVVMNLAINARDAMPEGGELAIRVLPGDRDRTVRLVVEDSGTGMPPDVVARIFEPYFTTKPRGKGTGLGLSIIHGIVEAHGGSIAVQSEPRRGTTFTVTLPCIATPGASAEDDGQAPGLPEVSGSVLLAEDNALVRDLVRQGLESMGLTVVEVEGGTEVCELHAAERGRFGLFVLDHDLPGVSGIECARRIRKSARGTPILIITGAADVGREQLPRGVGLLRKPFTLAMLRRAVAGLLTAGRD